MNGTPGRLDQVRRITWIGLAGNLILSALKFAAGLLGHSQALVADAVHSLSDMASDVAILVGVRYWSAPADADHPHGHQRIETMVTLLIGGMLTAVALGLIFRALAGLPGLQEGDHVRPGWIALGAALVSIAAKEGLYRWTIVVGKRVKSSALIANAWHHRSDALSSIPAALAVAGAALNPSWLFLDHVGAVVVSFFVFQAAWRIVRPAVSQLADTGASREDCDRIRRIVLDTTGVQQVHAVRTRYVGPGLQVDLHVLVDGAMSVREGHDISTAVKSDLLAKGPDVVDVVVHLEPE